MYVLYGYQLSDINWFVVPHSSNFCLIEGYFCQDINTNNPTSMM